MEFRSIFVRKSNSFQFIPIHFFFLPSVGADLGCQVSILIFDKSVLILGIRWDVGKRFEAEQLLPFLPAVRIG